MQITNEAKRIVRFFSILSVIQVDPFIINVELRIMIINLPIPKLALPFF